MTHRAREEARRAGEGWKVRFQGVRGRKQRLRVTKLQGGTVSVNHRPNYGVTPVMSPTRIESRQMDLR